MTHPQVVDGGDGLETWTVAVNMSNKQLLTADKEWSSISGAGRGANISSPKGEQVIKKCYAGCRNLWAVVKTVMNLPVP
jgi:hypothetical protein